MIHLGQLWKVQIPHTDSENSGEKRPCVIVGWSSFNSGEDQVILVVPITSHGQGGHTRPGEIAIPEPEKHSLTPGSCVRARRVFSIHPSRLTRNEGPIDTLSNEIVIEILETIAKLFDVDGDVRAR